MHYQYNFHQVLCKCIVHVLKRTFLLHMRPYMHRSIPKFVWWSSWSSCLSWAYVSNFIKIWSSVKINCFIFRWKGQAKATIIIPIRPISESDKCQLRGRWGAVVSWKFYAHCIYFSLGGSLGQLRGREGAVLSGKSYIHCIYFSLTTMGKLGGSRGQPRGI